MTSRGDALPKLLPCPFCGGEARRVDLDDLPETDVNAGGSLIECAQCFACTALQFDRKENLVSAWNDRAVTNSPAFPAEDYRHTAELLRSSNDKIVSATLSNNLNIILSALDHATRATAAPPEEMKRGPVDYPDKRCGSGDDTEGFWAGVKACDTAWADALHITRLSPGGGREVITGQQKRFVVSRQPSQDTCGGGTVTDNFGNVWHELPLWEAYRNGDTQLTIPPRRASLLPTGEITEP